MSRILALTRHGDLLLPSVVRPSPAVTAAVCPALLLLILAVGVAVQVPVAGILVAVGLHLVHVQYSTVQYCTVQYSTVHLVHVGVPLLVHRLAQPHLASQLLQPRRVLAAEAGQRVEAVKNI